MRVLLVPCLLTSHQCIKNRDRAGTDLNRLPESTSMADEAFDDLLADIQKDSERAVEEREKALEKIRQLLEDVKDGTISPKNMTQDEAVDWLEEEIAKQESILEVLKDHKENAENILGGK